MKLFSRREQIHRNLRVFRHLLKLQPCKLSNSKYMITSVQITNTEMFAFIAVLAFILFSRKVLFINRKDERNC